MHLSLVPSCEKSYIHPHDQQYWYLTNIDSQQIVSHPKLGEYLWTDCTYLISRLFKWPLPSLCLEGIVVKSPDTCLSICPASDQKSFSHLSVELIIRIFMELDEYPDCLSLALSCWRCWLVGEEYIRKFGEQYAGPWAGDRLICVGDYLDAGDLPKQLCTEDIQEELVEDGEPKSLYVFARSNFEDVRAQPVRFQTYDFFDNIRDYEHYYLGLTKIERTIFNAIPIQYQPPVSSLLILRNISQHQYVRETALEPLNNDIQTHNKWYRRKLDLGVVLMAHICWSTDPGTSLQYSGDIHRGVWAGDRFDIVTEDVLEERIAGGESWKDASKEFIARVTEIWKSDHA